MRLIALTILFAGLAGTAEAASFDCGKAATAFEHAICDSPDLSRQDEVLAKAYATAIGGLSAAAKGEMQADQRAWLDFAPRSCSTDASVPESYDDDGLACLGGAFFTRIKSLEQSRMQGGWRFYPREFNAVIDDPDPEWWGGVATKHFASPRIDDTVPTAEAFNTMMEVEDAKLGAMFDADGTLTDTEATNDNSVDVTVADVTPHRIGLEVNTYWMGHGAAHGNYSITHLHYLIDAQRALEASDLFVGDGWQAALGDLVIADLRRTLPDGIWEDAATTVPDIAADPARWSFSDAGLVVQFQPYEVTAYAMGAPTATIPWDALTTWLAPDYDSVVLY